MFSLLARLISPRQRRLHAELKALRSSPEFAEEFARQLREKIDQVNEEALVKAIFGEAPTTTVTLPSNPGNEAAE